MSLLSNCRTFFVSIAFKIHTCQEQHAGKVGYFHSSSIMCRYFSPLPETAFASSDEQLSFMIKMLNHSYWRKLLEFLLLVLYFHNAVCCLLCFDHEIHPDHGHSVTSVYKHDKYHAISECFIQVNEPDIGSIHNFKALNIFNKGGLMGM